MGKPDYESFDGWLRECNDDCLVFNVPRGDDIVDTLTLHITPDNEHGVYVRPITRSEIPELLAMYAEEEKVIVSDKLLIDAKISFTHLQITEGRILGAFTKGDILVGSLSLHYLYDLYPGYAHAPYAHLETIVVKEGHRGSGIGSILVSDAVKRCRDMGVTYILAQTKEDNYTMMRVYEKSGLQQSYVNYRIDL
jgi:ribosomal protein S18 acetylase RimI-like enzyme